MLLPTDQWHSATVGDNCWGSGSAGELDFLETSFWDPALYNVTTPAGRPNPNQNNSRHYVTTYNGAGHCFPVNKGVQVEASLQPPFAAGGMCSNNYFVDDGEPHLWAAVVDRRGVTVYRDPDWPGLTATSPPASKLTDAAPAKPERQVVETRPISHVLAHRTLAKNFGRLVTFSVAGSRRLARWGRAACSTPRRAYSAQKRRRGSPTAERASTARWSNMVSSPAQP